MTYFAYLGITGFEDMDSPTGFKLIQEYSTVTKQRNKKVVPERKRPRGRDREERQRGRERGERHRRRDGEKETEGNR